MSAGTTPLRRALDQERYDVVALRLLRGFLVALAASAPEAREALLDELTKGDPS